MVDIQGIYTERYPILNQVAERIQDQLRNEILIGVPHIDYISSRAKGIESFVQKALKSKEDGTRKYSDPFNQIQDQIGIRVVVYFLTDVEVVKEKVLSNYIPVENIIVGDDNPTQFSYQGQHFVFHVPIGIRETVKCPVSFFELQVHTLYQHAWAAANHDIGYKKKGELTELEQRKLAWAAAQSWGVDRIFDEFVRPQQEQSPN